MTLRFFGRGDKMQVTEKINALRKIMGDSNIDAYIIVTDDYHGSEYVGDYFKEREYMSGFTGSAGTRQRCGRTADIFCRQRKNWWVQA